jgi:hypothetical protein
VGDVEIDRYALESAKMTLDQALLEYRMKAEDAWRRDTGIGDPCGRDALRDLADDARRQRRGAAVSRQAARPCPVRELRWLPRWC